MCKHAFMYIGMHMCLCSDNNVCIFPCIDKLSVCGCVCALYVPVIQFVCIGIPVFLCLLCVERCMHVFSISGACGCCLF